MVCLWGAVYYPAARVWRKPLNDDRSVGGDDGVVGNDDSPADEEV